MEGIALAYGMHLAFRPSSPSTARSSTCTPTTTFWPRGGCSSATAAPKRPAATPPTSPAPCPSAEVQRRQKAVYEIVLAGQESAIKSIKPGINYKDIHLQTARLMADGLKGLGLMKGDTAEAVAAGATPFSSPTARP